MLHLHRSLSVSLHTNKFYNPSIYFFNHPSTSVSWFGTGRWDIPKKRRRNKYDLLEAVEKDSEFEVDEDKAREALRKLDEQLETLSKKQIDPPKIRATDVTSNQMPEETKLGPFLNYLTVGLLLFTLVYNILFATVIKPAIDGPDTFPEIDLMLETLEASPVQQLLRF